jgi:hypothetical protein
MQARTQRPWFTKEMSILPIAFFLSLQSANALTIKDIEGLTYSQIKGTGIANRCPEASSSGKEQEITLDAGTKYKLVDFCLEPKSFQVEQEIEKRKGVFVKGERCTGIYTPELNDNTSPSRNKYLKIRQDVD